MGYRPCVKPADDAFPFQYHDPFAGPNHTFPVQSEEDLQYAASLIYHAADPETVKQKAIAIAQQHGWRLPEEWQNDVCPEYDGFLFAPADWKAKEN